MKQMPTIKSVMTAFPYWIDENDSLEAAENMMSEHDISHLPVKADGKLVGVIEENDISKAKQQNTEYNIQKVSEVCLFKAYIVGMDEPLDNVVIHMANNHIHTVLINRNDRLAGVFTMSDACRKFAEYLRYQFRPPTGDDVA